MCEKKFKKGQRALHCWPWEEKSECWQKQIEVKYFVTKETHASHSSINRTWVSAVRRSRRLDTRLMDHLFLLVFLQTRAAIFDCPWICGAVLLRNV